jgi:hypothetical protein
MTNDASMSKEDFKKEFELREEFKTLNPTLFNLSYIVMGQSMNEEGEIHLNKEQTDDLVSYLYEFTEKEFRKFRARKQLEKIPEIQKFLDENVTELAENLIKSEQENDVS